jgi:hypothetical protein
MSVRPRALIDTPKVTTKKSKIGRPKGSLTKYPRHPIEDAVERALGDHRGRPLPADATDDLVTIVNFCRSQIAKIAAGQFSHRRGPTALKASLALLDEACGRIEERHRFGQLDIAAAVTAATAMIETRVPASPPRELPAAAATVVVESTPAPVGVPRPSDGEPPPSARNRADGCFCLAEHRPPCPEFLRSRLPGICR